MLLVGDYIDGTVMATFAKIQHKTLFVVTEAQFGAVGDGVADDTLAIIAAIAAARAAGGGIVWFPWGTYRTTFPIDGDLGNVKLMGSGGRNIQTPVSVSASANVSPTIWADHTGDLFTLSHTADINGFGAEGLTFVSDSTARAARCFGFDLGGAGSFKRDFKFRDISVQGFTVAFDLYESSAESGTSDGTMGVIRITESSIQHNLHIAQTQTGKHWNSFIFQRNESGQNGWQVGDGGIDIEAHNVAIEDNVLEGTRDPVIVRGGSWQATSVRNNYFESCVGDACIKLSGLRGPIAVGPNLYFSEGTTHKVLLYDCIRGHVIDPYWSQDSAKVNLPILGASTAAERNLNTAASEPILRVDEVSGDFLHRPDLSAVTFHAPSRNARIIDPFMGRPIHWYDSNDASHTLNYTINAAQDDWIVMCWLLKRKGSPTDDPYINIGINGTTTIDEAPVYSFAPAFNTGEWAFITKAVKATAAVTEVNLIIYPNGSGGAAIAHEMVYPVVYIVDDVNKVRPWYDPTYADYVDAAPTTGTWAVGDRLRKGTVVAGGPPGYICTTAGTPGTWKAEASVAA